MWILVQNQRSLHESWSFILSYSGQFSTQETCCLIFLPCCLKIFMYNRNSKTNLPSSCPLLLACFLSHWFIMYWMCAEVMTSAEFHPTHCNTLAYSSSKGSIRLIDLRQSALCDNHSKLWVSIHFSRSALFSYSMYFRTYRRWFIMTFFTKLVLLPDSFIYSLF